MSIYGPGSGWAGASADLCDSFSDYVKENENALRVLFGKTGDSGFAARLVGLLCSRYIIGVDGPCEMHSRFIRLFIAKGSVGLMQALLEMGFPVSSREIAEMVYSLSIRIMDPQKYDP